MLLRHVTAGGPGLGDCALGGVLGFCSCAADGGPGLPGLAFGAGCRASWLHTRTNCGRHGMPGHLPAGALAR